MSKKHSINLEVKHFNLISFKRLQCPVHMKQSLRKSKTFLNVVKSASTVTEAMVPWVMSSLLEPNISLKCYIPRGGALPLLRQRGCAPSLGVFFKEKFSYWVWNLSKISLNEVWIFVKISLNDHFSVKNSLTLFFKLSTQTEWNIHIGY